MTLHNETRTRAMTASAPGMKPVLALLIRLSAFSRYPLAFPTRLLCAAALVLPAFAAQAGVVFTTLHSFTGGNDGAHPWAGLVQGRDGYFYGTAEGGGTSGNGTMFQISTNGALTTLYYFTGGNDGAQPTALVQGRDGSFYGTAQYGGTSGKGTVFRLTIVPTPPVFQAVTITNSALNLTWSTEAGKVYQLQYSSGLSSTNWSNLGSALPAAGATLSAIDSATNGPRRFYRVVLLP